MEEYKFGGAMYHGGQRFPLLATVQWRNGVAMYNHLQWDMSHCRSAHPQDTVTVSHTPKYVLNPQLTGGPSPRFCTRLPRQ